MRSDFDARGASLTAAQAECVNHLAEATTAKDADQPDRAPSLWLIVLPPLGHQRFAPPSRNVITSGRFEDEETMEQHEDRSAQWQQGGR